MFLPVPQKRTEIIFSAAINLVKWIIHAFQRVLQKELSKLMHANENYKLENSK